LTPLDFASDRVEVNKDLAGDVFETIAGIPLFGLRKFETVPSGKNPPLVPSSPMMVSSKASILSSGNGVLLATSFVMYFTIR
jgi:hypothetical protein